MSTCSLSRIQLSPDSPEISLRLPRTGRAGVSHPAQAAGMFGRVTKPRRFPRYPSYGPCWRLRLMPDVRASVLESLLIVRNPWSVSHWTAQGATLSNRRCVHSALAFANHRNGSQERRIHLGFAERSSLTWLSSARWRPAAFAGGGASSSEQLARQVQFLDGRLRCYVDASRNFAPAQHT